MKTKIILLTAMALAVACSALFSASIFRDKENPNGYRLETDRFNPDWFWVKDSNGQELVFYRGGIIEVKDVNTNRQRGASFDHRVTNPFKTHGAVSVYGCQWGGVLTKEMMERGGSVQHWLVTQFWNNIEDRTDRNVNPDDVVIWSSEKPIVTEKNDEWIVTFATHRSLTNAPGFISAPGWRQIR